jgi:hypothetical protein
MTTLLATIVACLLAVSGFAQSRWGVDGGCGTCADNTNKAAVSGLKWMRVGVSGATTCLSKTNYPNWSSLPNNDGTYGLQGLKVWNGMVSNIVLDTAWHPPDLTDAEIVSWTINYNIAVLREFCDPASVTNYLASVKAIQPFNEPWIDSSWIGNSNTFFYLNGRFTTYTGPQQVSVWTNGFAGTGTTNALVPQAVAWLTAMKQIIDGIAPTAHALGIQIWAPHWQTPGYVGLTQCGDQMGLFSNVDVYCFGAEPNGEPLGTPVGNDGWANWIDSELPYLHGKPWACVELHLNNWKYDAPDFLQADRLRRGMEHWRDKGVTVVLVHVAFKDWFTGGGPVLPYCGYDSQGRPNESLIAVMNALSSGATGLTPAKLLGVLK